MMIVTTEMINNATLNTFLTGNAINYVFILMTYILNLVLCHDLELWYQSYPNSLPFIK